MFEEDEMMGESCAGDGHESPGNVQSDSEIKAIMALLLQCAGQAPENGDAPAEQEIVLEIRLDGAYYTLLRTPSQPPPCNALSPREREIARLVTKGLPNRAIAKVLEISPWTVATHMRRIFAKLGVSSRAEMVATVLRFKLL